MTTALNQSGWARASRAGAMLRGPWAGSAYYFLKRACWSVRLILLLSVVCVVCKTIWPHAEWLAGVGVLVMSTYMFCGAQLVGVFTYGGGDLGAVESGFPRHVMILPASTRALALMPMVFGSAAMSVLWLMLAKIVVDPMLITTPGIHAPLWPALLLAAEVAWLQAVLWTPFWIPFVRVLVSLALLGGLATFGILARFHNVPVAAVAGSYLVAIVAAYPVAVAGLSCARRGDGARAPWLNSNARPASAARTRGPFPSPMAAQVWLEVRRNILLVPFVSAAVPLALMVVTTIFGVSKTSFAAGPHQVQPILMVIAFSIAAPVFAAGLHGPMLGKSDAWAKAIVISPFIAARPLASGQLVRAKFLAAGVATVIAWGLVIAILGLWMLMPNTLGPGRSMARAVGEHLNWTNGLGAVVGLGWLLLVTWKQMAQSLFVCLYGRKWFSNILTIGGGSILSALCVLAVFSLNNPVLRQTLPGTAKVFVVISVGCKVVAGAALIVACRRRNLLTVAQIAGIVYFWLVLVALYFLLLFFLLPDSMKPGLGLIICIAAMLPPGARVLAALPAQDANRHR